MHNPNNSCCFLVTIFLFFSYAVVTGANKGIGFEICRQLASKGIVVVLTSRNEKRGLESVQKLKESGLSDFVVFHQLDVADINSIASLADFIKSQFGKLDILVWLKPSFFNALNFSFFFKDSNLIFYSIFYLIKTLYYI